MLVEDIVGGIDAVACWSDNIFWEGDSIEICCKISSSMFGEFFFGFGEITDTFW